MGLIFGLDIGIASIGWAAIDEELDTPLLGLGSRVFVSAEVPKTGESLALPRRMARGMRRRIRRRAHRMSRIRQLFLKASLADDDALAGLHEASRDDPTPWLLRADGLERRLNQRDWARVLLHIAKHRGFKSNRKSEASDKEGGKLLSGVTGNAKLLKDKGYRTIGEMVWKDEKFAVHKRNKGGDYSHTVARDDLLKEIAALFEAQRGLGNGNADGNFEAEYTKIFASQRPVDDGEIAEMVGECTFELGEKRAAKASYSAERFVLLSRLNNLMLIESGQRRVLTAAQREVVVNMAYKSAKVTYKQIRKALELPDVIRFNLVAYKSGEIDKAEDIAFAELKAYHQLRLTVTKSCGELTWSSLASQPDKLDAIATALTWYKSDAKIIAVLAPEQLEQALVDAVLVLSFDKAVALSLKALRNINPFLAQGLRYDLACTEAGYDHSAPTEATPQKLLPCIPVDEVRNPVVLRALTQARKVINAMIRRYGSPAQINIELARELSHSYRERKEIESKQKEFKDEKEHTVKQFNETFGHDPHRDELTKFRLWREYNHCAYSGVYLEPARLLEEGYAEIDHILPYSRSMDDSLNNKVLCTGKANRDKGNKTPYQYLSGSSASPQWHEYKVRIETHKAFRQAKRNRLLRVDFDEAAEKEFRERNLNDTRYIARFLQEFLKLNLQFATFESKVPVQTRNGAVTSFLRAHWGLLKVRDAGDLHHALDAAVVACTTQGFVKRISDYSRKKELWASDKVVGDTTRNLEVIDTQTGEIVTTSYQQKGVKEFPLPWDGFREDVKGALDEIFVSRAPTRKATGAIHDEKIRSSKRMNEETPVTTSKTKLEDLSLASLETIPDKLTRNANLYLALKRRLDTGGKEPFAKSFYLGKDGEEGNESNGRLVRTVKLGRTTKTGVAVRGGLADNGEMLRVDVFTKDNKFYMVPIYLADRAGGVLPNKAIRGATMEDGWPEMDETYRFAFSLCNNDLILISDKDGGEGAYIRGYFKGAHRGTGAINIEGHDRSWKKYGIGVQRLAMFKKLQVDVLGEVSEVKREPRHGLSESAD